MWHGILGVSLGLALSGAALPGRAEIGPDAVFEGDPFGCQSETPNDLTAWLDCLSEAGTSEAALDFARLAGTERAFRAETLLTRFEERGVVDVGYVVLPFLANTNEQMAFLNGVRPIAGPGGFVSAQPPDDGGTRAVLARYPTAFPSGRVVIGAHRTLPNGRQRFVVTDVLNDGCRACEVAGTLIAHIEFDAGSVVSAKPIGWTISEGPQTSTEAVAAILAGNMRELQRRLNLAGYDAGGMDGFSGPQTVTALAEFQSEYCFPVGGPPDRAQIEALVSANKDGQAGPCAASGSALPGLPLRDGDYASETRFCAPPDDPLWAGSGDTSYNALMTLAGDQVSFGESRCTIVSVAERAGRLDVTLDCDSEGEPVEQQISLRVISDGMFEWDGAGFVRCTAP